MAEFKSFGEFQKELHDPAEYIQEEKPVSEEAPVRPRHLRKRRHRPWGRYLLLTAAGLLVIGGGLFFLPLPVGDVRVFGNEALTKEDILFDGGITPPVNVFQISTSDLAERLQKDVRVASVEVVRTFPLYVDVKIAERKPIAVMQEDFGYAFLDGAGVVIRTGSVIRGMEVPMITGVKLGNALLGDTVRQEPVQLALQFLSSLSAEGLRTFSEINIGNEENLVAYTRDGIAVRLGDGSSMSERAALAENMVSDVKVRGLSVEYIDASLTSPYIKLKK